MIILANLACINVPLISIHCDKFQDPIFSVSCIMTQIKTYYFPSNKYEYIFEILPKNHFLAIFNIKFLLWRHITVFQLRVIFIKIPIFTLNKAKRCVMQLFPLIIRNIELKAVRATRHKFPKQALNVICFNFAWDLRCYGTVPKN